MRSAAENRASGSAETTLAAFCSLSQSPTPYFSDYIKRQVSIQQQNEFRKLVFNTFLRYGSMLLQFRVVLYNDLKYALFNMCINDKL